MRVGRTLALALLLVVPASAAAQLPLRVEYDRADLRVEYTRAEAFTPLAPYRQTSYCVKTGGSDGTAKGSIVYVAGNEAGSTCWQTIGRALWGSATRSSPSGAAAIAAGETVYVFGGTYSNALNCSPDIGDCKFDVLYDPVNEGTSAVAQVAAVCVGDCLIAAPDWNGPVVGSSLRDHVKWFADVSLGHSWIINSYAPIDDAAAADEVDITADTGPITCSGDITGLWFEGFVVDGGSPDDPYPGGLNENYPAFRIEHCANVTVRNNTISGFLETGNHGCGINNYHSTHGLYEYNTLDATRVNDSSGCFLVVKDSPTSSGISSFVARFNKISNVSFGFGWSITSEGTEPTTQVYQNLITGVSDPGGSGYGIYATGNPSSPFRADIFNNTFTGGTGSSCVRARTSYGTVRFWNNICANMTLMIAADATGETMPAESSLDLEHNDYFNFTSQFYSGNDGNRTKASFDAAYNGQHDDSPPSREDDPRFADSAGGDYRLCTAAATPDPDCAGASPSIALGVDALDLDGDASTTDNIPAGAYITNAEVLGAGGAAGGGGSPGGGVGSGAKVKRRSKEPIAVLPREDRSTWRSTHYETAPFRIPGRVYRGATRRTGRRLGAARADAHGRARAARVRPGAHGPTRGVVSRNHALRRGAVEHAVQPAR